MNKTKLIIHERFNGKQFIYAQWIRENHMDTEKTVVYTYVNGRNIKSEKINKEINAEGGYMEELLKQAELGDTDAMYAVGRAYQFAKFEERPDYEKAFYWYNKAAQLRHIEAMTSLADALSLGRGCKRDLEMAHVWYQEAYEMGRAKKRG